MTSDTAHQAAENFRGIICMMAAMAGFVTNDMFAKLAGETLATGQVVFLRGVLTTVLFLALAWGTGVLSELRKLVRPAVGLRSIGDAGATIFYLTALVHIPIADATAILQAMPLLMTVAAAVLLGETVRWRRWAAVVAGFCGMLMVVRPGADSFSIYSLVAVAALGFIALRDLSTRYVPLEVPGLLVGLSGAFVVTLAGLSMSAGETWQMPDGRETAYIAAAAASITVGYSFIIEAMRHGEVSVVAPFRYTIILWAIAYGYFIWGHLPDIVALAGITLIVGSGLFVFYRESRANRSVRAAAEASTESR